MKHALLILGVWSVLIIGCTTTTEEVETVWEDGSPRLVKTYEGEGADRRVVHHKEMYNNGNTRMEGDYDEQGNRHGTWAAYFEDGTKQSETTYKNGAKNGDSNVWYENGQLRYSGKYEQDVKKGEWTFYKEDGSIATTVNY